MGVSIDVYSVVLYIRAYANLEIIALPLQPPTSL